MSSISSRPHRRARGMWPRWAKACAHVGLIALLGGDPTAVRAGAQSSSPPGVMRVSAERATLREKASADAAAVAELTKGQELQVVDHAGAWVLVRVVSSGREGFVHNLLVEAVPAQAMGPPGSVHVSVALVDDQLNIRPVPRHVLVLTSASASGGPLRLVTGFDGQLDATVPAGTYTLTSERTVDFQGRAYRWDQPLIVRSGETLSLALSVDNVAGPPTTPMGGSTNLTTSPSDPPAVAGAAQADSGLVGIWVGTYADSPARLHIARQDVRGFTGTLAVTTQAGRADSELDVAGQLIGTRIELSETAVIARGAAKSWSLGRGTGTLSDDGQTISGSGKDNRGEYRWHFTRRATAVPVSAAAPVSAPAPVQTSPVTGAASAAPSTAAPARQDPDTSAAATTPSTPGAVDFDSRGCGPGNAKHEADTDKTRHPTPEPPPGMGVLYVVRPTMIGNKIQTKLAIDGQWVGVNRGNNYFFVTVSPGEHAICSTAENTSVLSLRVEAGHIYYVQQKITMGFMKARNRIELLSEVDGRNALAKTHLSVMTTK
ncbi:MAG: DUF2846 domain-containing protein [Acidobacteriota bacterium]